MQYLDLPESIGGIKLAIAVGQTSGAPFPADLFRGHGWTVLNPDQCAPDWQSYQSFLQDSRGEFSIAKHTYSKARTGWFSCRSACYLAAGRPVIAQDTGWSSYIPTGRGLLAFEDMDGARAALCEVADDLKLHGRVARELAEEYFAADKVLATMLLDLGSTPRSGVEQSGGQRWS